MTNILVVVVVSSKVHRIVASARGTLHHMCKEQAQPAIHSEWCNVHICFRDWLMFVLFCRLLFLSIRIHSMASAECGVGVCVPLCV